MVSGYGDILAQTPIGKDTTFGVGSITKVFVAIVILQLIHEEKLSLKDQASSILESQILDGIPHAKEACIGDLLNHTGGIPSWEDNAAWIKDGRGENIEPEKIWEKQATLQHVRGPGVSGFTVGKWHYPNTNYTLLGLIIERVTHNTAETEIRRRILQPLEMADIYLEGFEQPSPTDQMPHRYHWATDTFRRMAGISPRFSLVRDNLIDTTGMNLSVSWTAGGMISTPSDLLKLADALQSSKLFRAASS